MPINQVSRYNYKHQFETIKDKLFLEIYSSILEGDYILTEALKKFENNFARYIGSNHTIGVNSGTDALYLALLSLKIGKGDEVITVANTFHATVLAIILTGAKPILVDCDLDNYHMIPQQVESSISSNTKALLVVHLYGKVVNMKPLIDISTKYNIPIVEDACQAIGAKWKGIRAGNIGLIGCFSFHPSKNLAAAGDAGGITTNNSELSNYLCKLRHFGQIKQNEHLILGLNSKLDSLQALILDYKLSLIDKWNSQRSKIANKYKASLNHLPIDFQDEGKPYEHVYHLFLIRTKRRSELLQYLRNYGIDAVVRYPVPIHFQESFKDFIQGKPGQFPNTESLSKETLCLPIRPDMSDIEIEYICTNIIRFFNYKY